MVTLVDTSWHWLTLVDLIKLEHNKELLNLVNIAFEPFARSTCSGIWQSLGRSRAEKGGNGLEWMSCYSMSLGSHSFLSSSNPHWQSCCHAVPKWSTWGQLHVAAARCVRCRSCCWVRRRMEMKQGLLLTVSLGLKLKNLKTAPPLQWKLLLYKMIQISSCGDGNPESYFNYFHIAVGKRMDPF